MKRVFSLVLLALCFGYTTHHSSAQAMSPEFQDEKSPAKRDSPTILPMSDPFCSVTWRERRPVKFSQLSHSTRFAMSLGK
jgi:hypothetical protein